jgi:hypothetical protein
VLAIFVVTVVRRPDLARTLQMMSLALLLFLLLNPLIEVYMYAPLLIIAGFTALARQDALPLLISPPAGRTKSSSPG